MYLAFFNIFQLQYFSGEFCMVIKALSYESFKLIKALRSHVYSTILQYCGTFRYVSSKSTKTAGRLAVTEMSGESF